MKFGWVVMFFIVISLVSNLCRAGARADFYRHEPGAVTQEEDEARRHWMFVGCRPSAGECFNSCADHRAESRENSPLCAYENPFERVACFCRVGA